MACIYHKQHRHLIHSMGPTSNIVFECLNCYWSIGKAFIYLLRRPTEKYNGVKLHDLSG